MARAQVIHDLETMLKCFSNIALCPVSPQKNVNIDSGGY